MWFVDFGRQPNWKMKSHNWSNQKYKNGFFLMCSLWLRKLKLITYFFNSMQFSNKLQKLSFIKLHETNSFTPNCKNTFSPESHERNLRIDWNMFLHDPTWKSHLMKPCSFFSVFVRNFIAHAWFWLFSLFIKFINLSICSTPIHMRSDKQVKKSQNSHVISWKVFNTSNFLSIFLWLFTYPGH